MNIKTIPIFPTGVTTITRQVGECLTDNEINRVILQHQRGQWDFNNPTVSVTDWLYLQGEDLDNARLANHPQAIAYGWDEESLFDFVLNYEALTDWWQTGGINPGRVLTSHKLIDVHSSVWVITEWTPHLIPNHPAILTTILFPSEY